MYTHTNSLFHCLLETQGTCGGLGHWDLTYWPGCCCSSSSSSITSDEDHSSCPHLFSRCDESEDGYSRAILSPDFSPTFWAHILVEPTVEMPANLSRHLSNSLLLCCKGCDWDIAAPWGEVVSLTWLPHLSGDCALIFLTCMQQSSYL